MSKPLDLSKPLSDAEVAELRTKYTSELVDWYVAQANGSEFEGGEVSTSADPDDDPTGSNDGYEDMTQEVLVELLKGRELPHSGTKAEQIERLREADKKDSQAEQA